MKKLIKKIIDKLDGSTHPLPKGETEKSYTKKLYSGASIVAGCYFLGEHLIRFGDFEFYDFWGHEWLGLILIFVGLAGFMNFTKKKK